MSLRTVVLIAWGVFCVVWLVAGLGAKKGSREQRSLWPRLFAITAFVAFRFVKPNTLEIHSVAVRGAGTAIVIAGIAVAIWARFHLGRNWGMPMTKKDDPELITSGPYRLVRHPIYSGILLAAFGTALVTTVYVLVGFLALAALFMYSATVEERIMRASFPDTYDSYRAQTKMLIPYLL